MTITVAAMPVTTGRHRCAPMSAVARGGVAGGLLDAEHPVERRAPSQQDSVMTQVGGEQEQARSRRRSTGAYVGISRVATEGGASVAAATWPITGHRREREQPAAGSSRSG